jgi:hypothetical protein
VAPEGPLATSRTSRDPSSLERDYALGRALGIAAIHRFRDARSRAETLRAEAGSPSLQPAPSARAMA